MKKSKIELKTKIKERISRSKGLDNIKSIPIVLVALFISLSVTSYNKTENMINSISNETVFKAKEILNLEDPVLYKKYIENYNYTDKKYQEDLIKVKQYDDKIYDKYQEFLKYNNYKDDRDVKDIISTIKIKNPNLYFLGFNSFYQDRDYKEVVYHLISIIVFYGDKIKTSEIVEKSQKENPKINKRGNYYKVLFQTLNEKRLDEYIKNNKTNSNLYMLNYKDVFYKDYEKNINEDNEILKNYFLKVKDLKALRNDDKLNQDEFYYELTNIYNEYTLKMLNNPQVMKETLKILRATNEITENFYNLKNNSLEIRKGFINETPFIYLGAMMKNVVSGSNVFDYAKRVPLEIIQEKRVPPEMIQNENNYRLIDYISDTEIKMELSGYNDYVNKIKY